jgi:CheY-like chemotaxis protein
VKGTVIGMNETIGVEGTPALPVPGAEQTLLDVLLVEDDAGDALLVAEALAEQRIRLHMVRDGREAMAFLLRAAGFDDAPRPGLILLDLTLPLLDGRSVLAGIKADEDLRRIPVVVLTSSQAEFDVSTSYGRYANAYVVKPFDAVAFISVVTRTAAFYSTIARLPS